MATLSKKEREIEANLDELGHKLAVGNFPQAYNVLLEWSMEEGVGFVPEKFLKKVGQSPLRPQACAKAAEVLFHRGDNKKGRKLLKELMDDEEKILTMPGLDTRARLQFTEYFYSQREFQKALDLGEKILGQCKKDNLKETGEAYYYLARSCLRLHLHTKVQEHLDLALKHFYHALTETEMEGPITWRIGLVYLLRGFAQWRRGFIVKANSNLYAAKWFLDKTEDLTSKGNVHLSFGCILRSQGLDSVPEFNKADQCYADADHQPNRARVLTNRGRALGDQNWKEAHADLNEALRLCKKLGSSRQEAEVRIALSWLYQETEDGVDRLKEAEKNANLAIRLTAPKTEAYSPADLGEAQLSLGHCRRRQGQARGGLKLFKLALAVADDFEIAKLQANAHLSLAECYVSLPVKDLHQAVYHYEKAKSILSPNGGVDSAYLTQKEKSIEKVIKEFEAGYFLVTEQDTSNLKKVVMNVESWAITAALQSAGGIKAKAANLLGMKPQTFSQKLERLERRGL